MRHLDEGRLQAWLDRDRSGIDAVERRAVEAHLAECTACARQAEQLAGLTHRTRSLLSVEASPSAGAPAFADVVARAGALGRESRRRRAWTAAAWAASVVLALGVGWGANDVTRSGPSEPEPNGAANAPEAMPTPASDGPPALSDRRDATTGRVAATGGPRVVAGRVTSEDGRPLEAVQVYVPGSSIGTLTQADGSFSLVLGNTPPAPPEPFSLRAELIGYHGATHDVAFDAGEAKPIEFRLDRQALTLDQIVVTGAGARERTPATSGAQTPVVLSDSMWTRMGRADAENATGFALLALADRPVGGRWVGSADGTAIARTLQTLDDGRRLLLYQAEREVRLDETLRMDGEAVATVRRGDVWVTATGPLPADSLRALLERLR